MPTDRIVVDTNLIFSALVSRRARLREPEDDTESTTEKLIIEFQPSGGGRD
ncbi:MAG: hypothetical protein KDM63_05815 [Verrucomicrobiae bacterium]|nr:hypothetical protein [Verrucomicrobiae bacterium]